MVARSSRTPIGRADSREESICIRRMVQLPREEAVLGIGSHHGCLFLWLNGQCKGVRLVSHWTEVASAQPFAGGASVAGMDTLLVWGSGAGLSPRFVFALRVDARRVNARC